MGYPVIWRNLRRAEDIIRSTPFARAVGRKARIKTAPGTEELPLTEPADAWGTYAHVQMLGGGHSQYGSTYTVPPSTTQFYGPGFAMRRYADWMGVEDAMLLATVTQAGPASSEMFIGIETEGGDVGFIGAPPGVALDEVGVHLSDWCAIDWDTGIDPDAELPALASWYTDNPSSSGVVGLGLCQLFVRGVF